MTNVRTYATKDRPVPAALQSLLEYKDLTTDERFEFAARLKYIEEITKKIAEWRDGQEDDLRAFIDRIELDLYINLGAPCDANKRITSWLIHSSWTSDLSSLALRQAVPSKLLAELNRPQVLVDATVGEWAQWLNHQNSGLRNALDAFYSAETIDAALASLLVIDVILANLLSGVCRLRANPSAGL